LEKKYIKYIVILILIDAVSTIWWYYHMGIEEANPIMSFFIEKSAVEFIIAKFGISFISLGILSLFRHNKLSKIGIIIIMIIYLMIAFMHMVALFFI
tara:strand:+ start:2694 stop:2984 length:291 start_codon:yes stop_codon:yes gene_type:complete